MESVNRRVGVKPTSSHLRVISAALLGLATLLVGFRAGAEVSKANIAVKAPLVGDSVGASARKHLNVQTLHAEIEAAIQKNRKFNLLSRKSTVMESIRDEQKFAKSDLAKGNAAHEGGFDNAHYLMLPTVQNFVFHRETKPVPNIENKYLRQDSGKLVVSVQVVDTTSGAIMSTLSASANFATKQSVVNERGGIANSAHFNHMAQTVATALAEQLSNAVFPMRIINVVGGQVWLNRGEGTGMLPGDEFVVYRPGVALIDPDTGENLGSAETEIGRIKIERIKPKFSEAKVVKVADGDTIAKDDIVRRAN